MEREYPTIDMEELAASLRLACDWMVDVAQVQTKELIDERNSHGFAYDDWRGAMRGEYRVATGQWDFFCPIWHTGQAVKALVMAYQVLGDEDLLEAARLGAAFILDKQITDSNHHDFGWIAAFEDRGDKSNTSAIMECLDGLFYLADETGELRYEQAAIRALRWVYLRAFIEEEGLFKDLYDPQAQAFVTWTPRRSDERPQTEGRPLLEDAVFLKGNKRAEEDFLGNAFWETAERLLQEEEPPGNWIHFSPANAITGNIHPRHAYWWGMPMIDAWQHSGEKRYLACARRSADWYVNAQRHDGGLIRNTYLDYNTDSFGHETSGIACAAIFWQRLMDATDDSGDIEAYNGPTRLALDFCQRVQFTDPDDPNLRGAILSKVLPPDGTDRSPYHLRDLGTIFFAQAAALWLKRQQ